MNYRLDLVTLLQMLNQNTGILETDAVRIPGIKSRCRVKLHIVNGTISSYTLTDEHGVALTSQETMFKRIEHLVLEWRYTEILPSRKDTHPLREETMHRQPIPASPIRLRRIRQVDPQELQTWPRLYRSVYSLTANPITIERIISILGNDQRPEVIQQAVYVLLQQRFLQVEN